MRNAAIATLVLTSALTATQAYAQVDQQKAAQYFQEAAAVCEREGGRLWGVSLCGPMVFADPITQTIATNQPAPPGERPRTLGFANAPLEWGGMRWSMYMWQFVPVDDAEARQQLLLHELFHRIQPSLGLMVVADGDNMHLDTLDGRYWLQLEWKALLLAVQSSGQARAAAVRDAVGFRRERRRIFASDAERERADEIREGLAEYTGIAACAPDADYAIRATARRLTTAPAQPSFVKTFAYTSGSAYGVLLDAWSPGWTRRVTATSNLGELLRVAANVDPTVDVAAAAAKYGAVALRALEEQRDRDQQRRIADLRRRFVEGPVVTVPRRGTAAMNNTGATAIPGVGTVLREYRSTGVWGKLDATDGVLVSADGNTVTVEGPGTREGANMTGPGWTLTIAAGWIAKPAARSGSFVVVPQ